MLGKTKNSLFNLYKKKTTLFVFFFVFLGLVYPRISSASAVLNWAKKIAVWPFYYIVYAIVYVAIWITGLCGSLLNWVLSPDFIKLSYTNPGGPNPNPVIETGLKVTQGFANMFLVLILVYIAIAVILRLRDYEAKKLLPIFIVVALLVNFSPVICGLIVDASNIIMNFFIQDLGVDVFSETMGTRVEKMKIEFSDDLTPETSPLAQLAQLAILVPFLLVLSFILLLFTFIFMLRYLAIWLLVILSPIAFISYILPITRKYFEQWWRQFINWCFVGVTCGFFLYLAIFLVMNLDKGGVIDVPTTPKGEPGFNEILPYFVAVVFLGMGIVFGLATSAMGASTVMGIAKTKGRGVVRGAGRGAKWVGGRIKERGIRPLTERMRLKEAAGKISRGVEKVPVARWFLPEKLRRYGEMRPAIEKAQERAKPYSSRTLAHRTLKGADIQTDATGNLKELIERGDAEDLFGEAKKLKVFKDLAKKRGKKELSDQEILETEEFRKRINRPLQMAFRGGVHTTFLRGDPRLAQLVAGKKWAGDYAKMKPEEAVKRATSNARRPHIAKWEREVLEDKSVMDNLLGRGREIFEAVDTQVKRGQETALKTIDEMFSRYTDRAAKALKIDLSKPLSKPDHETLWSGFNIFYKKHHKGQEGYFQALKSKRFTDRGWRAGQYRAPGAPPPAPAPGAAAMGPPPPSGRRPGGKAPTGRRPGGTAPTGRRP